VAFAGGDYYLLQANGFVRRIDGAPTVGTVDTVAGPIFPWDGPVGRWPTGVARLAGPQDLVRVGLVWLTSETSPGRVRRFDPAADTIDTVIGHAVPGNAPIQDAALYHPVLADPAGLVYDAATGSVFVSERGLHTLWRLDVNDTPWRLTAFLGDGIPGSADGSVAAATVNAPSGLTVDAAGRALYVADSGNHAVRRVDLATPLESSSVTTVIGIAGAPGYFPAEGGRADLQYLDGPQAVLWSGGALFIADTGNNRVLKATPAAGNRVGPDTLVEVVLGRDRSDSSIGDGEPAWSLPIAQPRDLAGDSFGNLFVSAPDSVRVVSPSGGALADGAGRVTTLFGHGASPSSLETASRCLGGLAVVDGEAVADRLYVLDCSGLWLQLDRAVY
jgi:DNA-binding beta-propeller fold protein YncE